MDTGTRTGISYLANDGSDAVTAYRTSIRNLASWAEASAALRGQGLLSARPAAGKAGTFYKATDDTAGVLYYDNGTGWETVGASAPADGSAATPSLRTLGSGSTQAAAGNHTHGAASTLFVRKAANTSRSSTTTLADDPELVLALAASGTYVVRAVVNYRASTSYKLKMNFRIGSGVTFQSWTAIGSDPSNSTVYEMGSNLIAGNTEITPSDFVTADGVNRLNSGQAFYHDLVVTTAATGTYAFAFQWAQGVSDVTVVSVLFGSYLLAQRVA